MDRLPLILAIAVMTYGTRIAGFTFDQRYIPQRVDRALTYVPIAAIAALIVPGLQDGGSIDIVRLAGAVIAAAVILVTRQLWASLLAGMVVFWLLG